MRVKFIKTIYLIIYIIGAIAGFTLTVLTNWPDYEAAFFEAEARIDEPLKTLKCPVMITTKETGTVTISLKNTYDRTVTRTVLTKVSSTLFSVVNDLKDRVTIEPGESQEVSWIVNSENATYRSLIMVRIYVLRNFPFPEQDASCGIFVLDTAAFTGKQILTLLAVIGAVGMGLGAFGWIKISKPLIKKKLNIARALITMILILTFAVLTGYLKMWLLGGMLLLVAVLLTITIIPMYVLGYNSPDA